MKIIIGLIPLYDDERDSYWMLPGYMKMLEMFGAVPVMLPLTEDKEELEECIALCDGFLLTGGHDVDPMVYGKRKESYCGKMCELRDRMECYLLDAAMKKDIPVLGICRGIQMINAHLGGDLYLLDADLMAAELSDLTNRTEKKNAVLEKKKTLEEKRRKNGKGRLTQEELDKMTPLTIKDIFENKYEIGTITKMVTLKLRHLTVSVIMLIQLNPYQK